MTTAQEKHLRDIGFKPEKIAPIPPSIVEKTMTKAGHQSAVIEMDNKETPIVFPGCTHLAYVPWLKTQGLWSDYEAFLEGGSEEEAMDINFGGRLEQAKEISDEQNGIPKPPEPPKVPEAPKVPEPVVENEDEEVEEVRFNRYVERLKYAKEQGFITLDTSVNGYVTEDEAHFIDANTLKNFEAPDEIVDAEFTKFVAQRLKIEWEHPRKKTIKEALEVVPDVAEGLEEPIKNLVPDLQEEELIEKRIAFLIEHGYKQNLNTYVYEHETCQDLSSSLVKNVTEKGKLAWKETAIKIKNVVDHDTAVLTQKEAKVLRDFRGNQFVKEQLDLGNDFITYQGDKMEFSFADGKLMHHDFKLVGDQSDKEWELFKIDMLDTVNKAKESFEDAVIEHEAQVEPETTDHGVEIDSTPEDKAVVELAGKMKDHLEKPRQAKSQLVEDMDFVDNLARIFKNYSDSALALHQIKAMARGEGTDKFKMEAINNILDNYNE